MMQLTLNAHAVKRCTFVAFSCYPMSECFFLHEFFVPYYAWSCHLITHRIKDQGHHNDLFCPTFVNSLSSNTPILNPKDISQSVIVTDTASAFVDTTSDSDLYHHRITSNVSGGASYHACTQQRHSPCNSHIRDYLSTGVLNWFCVSKSLSSSPLCTQCASIAHSQQQLSNITCHCRNCHVRKKFNKQQRVLREVAILCNQLKLSIQEIEDAVIVFDGGNPKTPPILPPDVLTWWCMPISDVYVEDKTNPNFGLSCPWVNNSLTLVWLPRSDALSIIASSGLNRIYPALEACEKLRKPSCSRWTKVYIHQLRQTHHVYLCGESGFEV